MTGRKITDLEEIDVVEEVDELLIIDKNDTSAGPLGTDKRATIGRVGTVFEPYIDAATAEADRAEQEADRAEAALSEVTTSTGTQTLVEALDNRVVYVDTAADLQALDTSGLVEEQQASVGDAGMFVWSGSEWLPKNSETITVRIPSDYPTLQEAIDTLSNFKTAQGVTIDLLIESGHVIKSQVLVRSSDVSHFTIKSEDFEVVVERESLAEEFEGGYPLFGGSSGARMPRISCLFKMDDTGYALARDGIRLVGSCFIIVSGGCGVKDAGGNGANIRESSWAYLRGSIFTGSGKDGGDNSNGISVSGCSWVNARNADVSDSGAHGFRATTASIASCFGIKSHNSSRSGLRVSLTSVVFAREADVQNSGSQGIDVSEGSLCSAENATLTGNNGFGVQAQKASKIFCSGANVSNSGSSGFNAIGASEIDADDSIADNCGEHGYSASSSKITAMRGSAKKTEINGLQARRGGEIVFIDGVATDCWRGASATSGSKIVAQGADFSGYTDRGINCSSSDLVIDGAEFRQDGENESGSDCVVGGTGCIIKAGNSNGGFNRSTNTLTVFGIIFK